MDKILHHQGWWFSHYLRGFIHPRWLAGFLPSSVAMAAIANVQVMSHHKLTKSPKPEYCRMVQEIRRITSWGWEFIYEKRVYLAPSLRWLFSPEFWLPSTGNRGFLGGQKKVFYVTNWLWPCRWTIFFRPSMIRFSDMNKIPVIQKGENSMNKTNKDIPDALNVWKIYLYLTWIEGKCR